MTIIIGGKTVNTGADVDTNTAALRVVQRPNDLALSPYAGSGAFAIGVDNGSTVMTAGAQTDAEIFQWRWSDPTAACVIRSIRVSCGTVIAFAAGRIKCDLMFATQYTAVGTGGINPSMATQRSNLKRSAFPPSQMLATNIRIATTTPLTAGTRTLDTQPIASWQSSAPAAIGPLDTNRGMITLWQRDTGDETPIILNTDEGFVIRLTCPATGTYFLGVTVEWYEADARLTYS